MMSFFSGNEVTCNMKYTLLSFHWTSVLTLLTAMWPVAATKLWKMDFTWIIPQVSVVWRYFRESVLFEKALVATGPDVSLSPAKSKGIRISCLHAPHNTCAPSLSTNVSMETCKTEECSFHQGVDSLRCDVQTENCSSAWGWGWPNPHAIVAAGANRRLFNGWSNCWRVDVSVIGIGDWRFGATLYTRTCVVIP